MGDAVSLAIDLEATRPIPGETAVYVYFGDAGGLFKGAHPSFADEDGELCASTRLVPVSGGAIGRASLRVPYVAFPSVSTASIELRVVAGLADGTTVATHTQSLAWPSEAERARNSLIVGLACAAVGMMRATRALDDRAREAITKTTDASFHFDDVGRSELARAIEAAASSSVLDGESVGVRLRRCATDEERPRVVEYLLDCALADGVLDASQAAFVRALAAAIAVEGSLVDAALARRPALDLAPHYKSLELESGATFAEVKKAYVRLAREYHPDKVQGLPKGFQDFANERLRAINAAYAALGKALKRE
jgi:uncharacterized tellurite resistance protein B-like protein